MLDLFHALAVRLRGLRGVSLIVIFGFGGLFAYAALSENAPDRYLTSGIAGLCWGLLLFVFISLFQQVPEPPTDQHSRWQRIKLRMRRLGYGFLGLATLGLTITVIFATFRVLR